MNHTHPSPNAQSPRSVPLQGAPNCRDLGGYLAADGRRVKWKHIYRSDSLADLTDADLPIAAALGLHALIDLRDESERQRKPNRDLPGKPHAVHACGFLPYGNRELFSRVVSGTVTLEQLELACLEAYGRFPPEPTYAKLLELLLTPDAFPLMIHCTSGKDRTGFASAVVLMALDVPRATIIEDFMLTNQHRRDISFLVGDKADPAVVEVLSGVKPSYLEASFAAIDARWGSTANYLRDGLGLSDQRRKTLQDALLEIAPA
jgi:protein-tyrosine phosphatase